MAATTTTNAQPVGLARWTPSLPTNLMNMFNPFAMSNNDADTNDNKQQSADAHKSSQSSLLKRPLLSPNQGSEQSDTSGHSRNSMFAEPESRSSNAGSREGSIDGVQAKMPARPKTRYSLCHPPPESKTRQKLHRRPRSLLQLHRLSTNVRPLPALEVIPSANFSIPITRAVTRVFKAKHRLCPNDLVILKAESYGSEHTSEDQEAQDVVGLICKERGNEEKGMGKVHIHTPSGTEWEANTTVTGGYEFFSTDEHGLGLTVRWVPKKNKDGGKVKTKDGRRKFNFSTISPNRRRHPVIATLSSTSLDINDTYRIPETSSVTPLSSPMLNGTVVDDEADDEASSNAQCETDQKLRELIALTAIFVTFKEGWSPSFRYDEKEKDGGVGSTSPMKSRKLSISSPPNSPPPFELEKRNSISSLGSVMIRRSSKLNRSNRSSTASIVEADRPSEGRTRSGSINKTGRSRTDSASTVLVHRAASNRRKNNSLPWQPEISPSRNPLQETVKEELPRDLPAPRKEPPPLAAIANGPIIVSNGRTSQPCTPDDADSGAEPRTPRSRFLGKPQLMESHRQSTVTTDTSASSSPTKAAHARGQVRQGKKSGWRRLFCGVIPQNQ